METMGTLRCLISNMPQKLLSDIVLRTAQQHMNIDVVGDASIDDDLPTLVKDKSVDLLLIGIKGNTLPVVFNELLDSKPELMIVCLIDDGRRAAIFVNDIGAGELEALLSAFRPARIHPHNE